MAVAAAVQRMVLVRGRSLHFYFYLLGWLSVNSRYRGAAVEKGEQIEIREGYIELYKILKLQNLVASGGEAKYVIAEGMVLVNGSVETR
ncbi:RNA-binding S4 domain-containing protein, partial [Desulfolithobacter sp.]